MKTRSAAALASRLVVGLALYGLGGCSTTKWPIAPAQLTPAGNGKFEVRMDQLAHCQAGSNEPVTIDPAQPLTLIVHGCNASGGNYQALAKVFHQQGQQALCFNYDDRDRITRSADQLRATLESLLTELGTRDITVIGHSQGGLVARRALVQGSSLDAALQGAPAQLRLVTASTPFGGIEAASHCGSTALAIASLGLTIPICQLVTGSKWRDIPPGSDFITRPGTLVAALGSHLKIITDESGSCRTRAPDGTCLKDDLVFSLAEQRQSVVDQASAMREQTIRAGHVEIVGDAQQVPYKLITLLQHHGILADTMPAAQFQAQLRRIYGAHTAHLTGQYQSP